jgi:hypothetical protein
MGTSAARQFRFVQMLSYEGYGMWSLKLKNGKTGMFVNRVLRRIFGSKNAVVT